MEKVVQFGLTLCTDYRVLVLCSSKMAPSLGFTETEETHLIEFVRDNPILYDSTHKYYWLHDVKDQLWKDIGFRLNKEGDKCQKKWKHIRDYYVRRRKQPNMHYKSTRGARREALLAFLDVLPSN